MHPWCHTAQHGIVTDSEEVGTSEVGSSGKVSLSEKVVLVPLAIEAVTVKEGCGFLPSRLVSPRWTLGPAVKGWRGFLR